MLFEIVFVVNLSFFSVIFSSVDHSIASDVKEAPELRLYKENKVKSKGNVLIPDEIDEDPSRIRPALDYLQGTEPNCARASLDSAAELFKSESYFPNVGSILILHDKCGSAGDEYVTAILEALHLRGLWNGYNIFALNYPGFMCEMKDKIKHIVGMKTDLQSAPKKLTAFFTSGISSGKINLDQINIIGLGLGAQMAGELARNIKNGNKKVKSIVGLNPTEFRSVQLVSKDDAQVVQLLHTYSPDGTESRVGSADFVFNGAKTIQPLCKKRDDDCSHTRSFKIFTAVVLYTSRFQAWPCTSWEDFAKDNSKCTTNFGYVFYPPDETLQGTYYLRADKTFPYGLGEDGRKFDKQTLTNELKPGYKPKINKRKPKTG